MAFPRIPAITERDRPFWSIMIPTYCPRVDYLRQALTSVFGQLAINGAVQIELVDDASPDFAPPAFLQELGVPGVSWHRNERRLGLAENWNMCLTRARGYWIHLLHQDDSVLPGFYDAMRAAIRRAPEIGAAFCNTYFTDRHGKGHSYTIIDQREAGILTDWQQHVFVQLAIQTPSIVVRRDVYETLGGFDSDFSYIADWDMWKRLVVRYPIWYEPHPLASYRRHPASQTARLRGRGRDIVEIAIGIERSAPLLPPEVRTHMVRRARRAYSIFAVENAFEALLRDHAPATARAQLAEARRLSSAAGIAGALGVVALRTLVRSARYALGRGRAVATGD
jgi:glycosyltransferase involved in cell wall biosynthesis